MSTRKKRSMADLIESALEGARDNANFPVRGSIDVEPLGSTGDGGGERRIAPPEERDALSTVPGERRRI